MGKTKLGRAQVMAAHGRGEPRQSVIMFVAHGPRVLSLARARGWLPAARYTNLRDVRHFDRVGFIDIEWRNYSFRRHLQAVRSVQPMMTVAQDIEDAKRTREILDQAEELAQYCSYVIVVPKDPLLTDAISATVPERFMLGYSVPTRYGGTPIPLSSFQRPVHLLGGRPDAQRRMAESAPVVSVDCNRFTLDAAFGDYFDGHTFRPHPAGGYERCLADSIRNISALWNAYEVPEEHRLYV